MFGLADKHKISPVSFMGLIRMAISLMFDFSLHNDYFPIN